MAHATIVPSSTTRAAGHVLRHPHTAPLDLEGALKELVILDAGGQAVQIVSGGRVHPGLPLPGGGILRYTEGSRGDIKKTIGVWRYLEQHFEVERKMWYLPEVISLTGATSTSLLCRHWPGVVRVAEVLLQKKTLTGRRY